MLNACSQGRPARGGRLEVELWRAVEDTAASLSFRLDPGGEAELRRLIKEKLQTLTNDGQVAEAKANLERLVQSMSEYRA